MSKSSHSKNPKKATEKKQKPAKTAPIKKKEDVEKSKDEKIDEDFPGYPHYPAKEDILNPKNGFKKIDSELEDNNKATLQNKKEADEFSLENGEEQNEVDNLGIVPGTEADVTVDDIIALGPTEQDMDSGEDESMMPSDANLEEFLEDASEEPEGEDLMYELGKDGSELDVPGAEEDDAEERMGEEDEENNYYSLGGDEKDSLEDDITAKE
jgi:hypothetical protein